MVVLWVPKYVDLLLAPLPAAYVGRHQITTHLIRIRRGGEKGGGEEGGEK
jgi:hypothetical protein